MNCGSRHRVRRFGRLLWMSNDETRPQHCGITVSPRVPAAVSLYSNGGIGALIGSTAGIRLYVPIKTASSPCSSQHRRARITKNGKHYRQRRRGPVNRAPYALDGVLCHSDQGETVRRFLGRPGGLHRRKRPAEPASAPRVRLLAVGPEAQAQLHTYRRAALDPWNSRLWNYVADTPEVLLIGHQQSSRGEPRSRMAGNLRRSRVGGGSPSTAPPMPMTRRGRS